MSYICDCILKFFKIMRTIVALVCLFLVACGPSDQGADSGTVGSSSEQQAGDALMLNNGSKWKINQEMKVHLDKMQSDIRSAVESQDKNHQALAVSLQGDIKSLVSSCTMSGPAHDELHKWLVPFMEKVDDYSDENDPAKADRMLAEIISMMETFNRFFE